MKENKERGRLRRGHECKQRRMGEKRKKKGTSLVDCVHPWRGRGGKVLKWRVSVSQILCLCRKPLRPSLFPPGLMISLQMEQGRDGAQRMVLCRVWASPHLHVLQGKRPRFLCVFFRQPSPSTSNSHWKIRKDMSPAFVLPTSYHLWSFQDFMTNSNE